LGVELPHKVLRLMRLIQMGEKALRRVADALEES
jgi:hypothetical protein